tara:strand:+ start:147 stop:959 length:813 start_codon:yes stop_codon:yes gene_type:complete
MENKDSVQYQSRKFKLNLSGVQEASGTFTFDVPPPSDIAFSDKYRSCLIMLRSIEITMYPAQALLDAGTGQIFGRGLDALWVNDVNPVAATNFLNPSSGIIVETDLPCKQNAMAQTNVAIAGLAAANAAGGALGNGRYCKTISDAVVKNGNIGKVNNTGAGAGLAPAGTYQVINIDGTQEIRTNCGGAGVIAPHTGVTISRKPVWTYETTANILDEGLLGATPFGRPLTLTLRDAVTGDKIWLYSKGTPLNVAANQRTSINAEFEFLMMP